VSGPLLSVSGLSVRYGRAEAIKAVDLSVDAGQIVSVIGANGAGKSTLLNCIMGVLRGGGTIAFEGRPIQDWSIERRAAMGLILIPERRELFTSMTVDDNLRLGAYKLRPNEPISSLLGWVYELFPRLLDRRRQIAGTLSGGERQMLAMGRALMGKPKLLMLDEPSLGLAPLIVQEVLAIVQQLRQNGVAILLVEQNARAALRISDVGTVLENGAVVLQGPSQNLVNDRTIAALYMGSSLPPGEVAAQAR
jgi:branched-chain amino acid transport system ATP-binding protein